ncbi:Uu.00g040150.m01.CDS01 [Anthostomella pinea]|uniref:Eukaryotic translation initiation factor 3 subunit J n=1 Tax=Anthostomella pinea TaxID=933095 RepID=A0AAI8VAT5_9PEZI|nr:Uu.00g040150.m01.CDS01 [Anthostomella pinea]
MPAKKQWDDEESDSSTPPSSPPAGALRRKFDDEEENDSDVLDSWDAAEDSEVEREKTKKAAEAKAKADAEAAANKKSKAQRVAEHQAQRAHRLAEGGASSDEEEETEAERRERMRRTEKEADLNHARDLFGDAGISLSNGRKATTIGSAIPIDASDPNKTVDLASLPLFNPQTKLQFETLRNTMVPIVGNNSKKAHYTLFLQEFSKQLAKDLPSDQIKKIASALTAFGNEKMKEEKAAEKGGKKTKAQKTKTQLVTNRTPAADVGTYEEDFGDDDFM